MGEWSYGVNDPATVKVYSQRTFRQAIQRCVAFKLCRIDEDVDGENNIVQILDETQKGPGDAIKVDLIPKLSGAGVKGDNTLDGNEESLQTYQDTLLIDQLRHAVRIRGAMSQQRVPFKMRDKARGRLSDWWWERWDLSLLNQLTGNTNQTDLRFTGLNACVAPTTSHMIFANGQANEAALTTDDVFTLDLIDNYVAKAHTFLNPIKPIILKGGFEVHGVGFFHPFQIRSMRKNYTTGQWGDIQKAAMTGGQVTGNPIFNGAVGMYAGVVIHEDGRVPYGNTATNDSDSTGIYNLLGTANVARGVICGGQAMAMAMGRAYDTPTKLKWVEELLDGHNILRATAGSIFGMKKLVWNSEDFATVTVSSHEIA